MHPPQSFRRRGISGHAITLWWKLAFTVVLLGGAAVAAPIGGYLLKAWWDEFSVAPPNITLRRVAFFWVSVDRDIYQIAAVLRLYNLGDKPYLVKGVALEASKLLRPRRLPSAQTVRDERAR
jgi:hypothetical protein